MYTKLEKILLDSLREANIRFETNKSLAEMTSWKIGGLAWIVVYPGNISELEYVIKKVRGLKPFYVIGSGTNLLIKDEGYPNVIIKLDGDFKKISFTGTIVEAGAAISLAALGNKAADNSLSGLEFASGIPGSLGGAVIMNAGAYGSEIKDLLIEVEVFDVKEQYLVRMNKNDLIFSYRNSLLKGNPRFIVTKVILQLKNGNEKDIKKIMRKYRDDRFNKQPYDLPNAGSIFKNPPNNSAGKLIEEAGLKGFSINDAEISLKHGNFIVNKNKAKAEDVIELIKYIEKTILDKYNIVLEREIIILG